MYKSIIIFLLAMFVLIPNINCGGGGPPIGYRSDYFPVDKTDNFRYINYNEYLQPAAEIVFEYTAVGSNKVFLNGPTYLFGGFSEFTFSDSGIFIGTDDFDLIRFPLEDKSIWFNSPEWNGETVIRNVSYVGSYKVLTHIDSMGFERYDRYYDVFLISTSPSDLESVPTRIWVAKNLGIIAFTLYPDGTYYLYRK